MKALSAHFIDAVNDYIFLLERNYSQPGILKLVGDRYQLAGEERSMLMRGLNRAADCRMRKEKTITDIPESSKLFVDGHNIIRTLGSYFLGKRLFISMDGFLRDASEMHRKTLPEVIRNRCVELVAKSLMDTRPSEVTIYLDEPVSRSGELAAQINALLRAGEVSGTALTVLAPDHHLKRVESGIVCTADSTVIDQCHVVVLDLARKILNDNYAPDILSLEDFSFEN